MNTKRLCKAPKYWKMTQKCLYLSTALLLALNINDHRCKLVVHKKCTTLISRGVLLKEEIIIATSSWTASIMKEMPSELRFNCLWLKKRNTYLNTNRMWRASNYWKNTHKHLYLSRALLFALNINNHRYEIVEHNKCSDMTSCLETYSSRRVSL